METKQLYHIMVTTKLSQKSARPRYEMPSCQAVTLKSAGVLCASPNAANQAFDNDEVVFVW